MPRTPPHTPCCALLLMGCAFLAPAQAALQPPAGFTAAVQQRDKEARECKPVAKPHTESLELPSKYEGSDKARDDLNEKSYAEYKAKSARINALEKEVSASVEAYLRRGQDADLGCALQWLVTWADAGAMLSRVTDHTGRSVRKWALRQHAAESSRIESWLAKLSDIVIEDWSNQPIDKFNNHEYWAAWAVMASAVALDRRDYFDWALTQYRRGAEQVDAAGFLPNELKRDTRALAYHNYSLSPLAMLAAFAEANGASVLPEGNYALQRLAQRVLEGMQSPEIFQARTGHKQNLEDVKESSKFAWMEPYCAISRCDARALARLEALRPMKTYRLGGNVTELFEPAAGAAAPQSPAAAALAALPETRPTWR